MSDTIALTRLAWLQYRWSLIVITALVTIGVGSALWYGVGTDDPAANQIAIIALMVSMLPAAVWTLALFDFNAGAELLEGSSGYSPWLLRMPIADWKLALVPVTLRAIWICGLWIIVVSTVHAVEGYALPVVGPAICFSAVGTWFSVVSWRPFTNGWWRLAAIAVGGVMLFSCVVAVLLPIEHAADGDRYAGVWMALRGLAYVLFVAGVWMSIRAVKLARTNSAGLIPAKRARIRTTNSTTSASRSDQAPVRNFASPFRALLWHDLQRSREVLRKYLLLCIAGIVASWLFLPLRLPNVVLVIAAYTYVAIGASVFAADLAKPNLRLVLRAYLAASPLRTSTIAWSRQLLTLVIIGSAMTMSLIALVGTLLWDANRELFHAWSTDMIRQTGWPHAGLRIAAAIFLSVWTIIAGRVVAHWWMAFSGKQWLHITMAIVFFLAYFVPVLMGGYWFAQQTSWETATATAWYWAGFLPPVVVTWLTVKALAVGVVVWQLQKLRLAPRRSICWVLSGWCLLTGMLAFTLAQLIPHPYASLPWCLAAVTICVPLVRVLVLPISLYFGRHQ